MANETFKSKVIIEKEQMARVECAMPFAELNEIAKAYLAVSNNQREHPNELYRVELTADGILFVICHREDVDDVIISLKQWGWQLRGVDEVTVFTTDSFGDGYHRREWEIIGITERD